MGVKSDRAAETRSRLIVTARRLFAEHGYAATGTEAILAEAGVTRGALYHHFADKQALFAAVCEQLHTEAEAAILDDANQAPAPWQAVADGSLAFLDFMVRPEVRRILVLEAPSVLGWAAWNEMDRRHGFGRLMEGVAAAVEAGELSGDPETLAVLLNGALNYAVVWAGQSADPALLSRVKTQFLDVIDRLRA